MLFAFTSRGFYIIDCQNSPNIIFDFAHHRFLHETGLERHFSTASQFSYDNACVCSNNKPLDWFSSLFFVCAFFHFVTNHSNNEIGIIFALRNDIIFCSISNPIHCMQMTHNQIFDIFNVPFFSPSTLTALLAAVLNCISASVLSASAGTERVNIMHPASAADTARRISLPCFMV